MNTPPITKTPLVYDGTIQGVACGERPSGLFVGRGPDAAPGGTVHVAFPMPLAYAPNAAAVVRQAGTRLVDTTSDGRVRVSKAINDDVPVDVPMFLDKLEGALADGRGGIPEQSYGGVYVVARCPDEWAYEVTCKASGRAALKRIGTWTGTDGVFRVPYSAEQDLAALLEKADIAEVKGTTTTINLPVVPGLAVVVDGGQIVIPWPGDADAALVKTVPSMRWDKERKAYTVSTRYSKAVAAMLAKVATRRAGEASAQADIARDQADILRARLVVAAADEAKGPLSTTHVKVSTFASGAFGVRFPYNESAVSVMRKIPGAAWDAPNKLWKVPAVERPALRSVVERLDAFFARQADASAAEREQAQARLNAAASARRTADTAAGVVRRSVFTSQEHTDDRLPMAGTIVVLPKLGPMYVESVGKGVYQREDAMSFGGDADSGYFHDVVYRQPDPVLHADAIAAYANMVAVASARRERASAVKAIRATILQDGTRPEPGMEGPWQGGEVLDSERPDLQAYGGGSSIVRAADGAVWHVQGNSADGDDWSHNDQSRGIGSRIPPGEQADTLTAQLRALALPNNG